MQHCPFPSVAAELARGDLSPRKTASKLGGYTGSTAGGSRSGPPKNLGIPYGRDRGCHSDIPTLHFFIWSQRCVRRENSMLRLLMIVALAGIWQQPALAQVTKPADD